MPRGVYERKGPKVTVTLEEAARGTTVKFPEPVSRVSTGDIAITIEPARACSRCVSFAPSDDRDARNRILGLCHFWPRPELVNAEHHCRQWEGKK